MSRNTKKRQHFKQYFFSQKGGNGVSIPFRSLCSQAVKQWESEEGGGGASTRDKDCLFSFLSQLVKNVPQMEIYNHSPKVDNTIGYLDGVRR